MSRQLSTDSENCTEVIALLSKSWLKTARNLHLKALVYQLPNFQKLRFVDTRAALKIALGVCLYSCSKAHVQKSATRKILKSNVSEK